MGSPGFMMELRNLLVGHSEDVSFAVNDFSGYSVVYHIQNFTFFCLKYLSASIQAALRLAFGLVQCLGGPDSVVYYKCV